MHTRLPTLTALVATPAKIIPADVDGCWYPYGLIARDPTEASTSDTNCFGSLPLLPKEGVAVEAIGDEPRFVPLEAMLYRKSRGAEYSISQRYRKRSACLT